MTPLSARSFALQLTIGQGAYDKLRYAQALLGHLLPAGEIAAVLERALDALIRELEKRKFAATTRPRPRSRGGARPVSANPRYIAAEVKRAVWERDGGQCTFVSDEGKRCPACSRLELDHVDPVARGGQASVERMRLRCRTHNQYAAECAFGAGFMSHKRAEAQHASGRVADGARVGAKARAAAAARARAMADEPQEDRDVTPWLRALGFTAGEARRAAAHCDAVAPDAPLEERVRLACSHLAPAHRHVGNCLAMVT